MKQIFWIPLTFILHSPAPVTYDLRLITSIPISSGYSVRMYAQTQLKQRLIPNRLYYLEYYTRNHYRCSTDGGGISHQGVLLTDTLVRGPLRLGEGVTGPLDPILLDPQLETDSVVAYGTEKWFKIHHCFQADQAYEFMTSRDALLNRKKSLDSTTIPVVFWSGEVDGL